EETTGKLIELGRKINQPDQKFSDDVLAKFQATPENIFLNTNNTILLKNAHTYIRSLNQK
ncbi:MAG TPA: hypothetical protein VM884_00610, partial [Flavisolibacter sp.]|nr:hypothetical protein [Flavisolibacter sp.]